MLGKTWYNITCYVIFCGPCGASCCRFFTGLQAVIYPQTSLPHNPHRRSKNRPLHHSNLHPDLESQKNCLVAHVLLWVFCLFFVFLYLIFCFAAKKAHLLVFILYMVPGRTQQITGKCSSVLSFIIWIIAYHVFLRYLYYKSTEIT